MERAYPPDPSNNRSITRYKKPKSVRELQYCVLRQELTEEMFISILESREISAEKIEKAVDAIHRAQKTIQKMIDKGEWVG